MMKHGDFIQSLRTILARPTSYNNTYPYNVGYYNGSTLSFDCWCLIKAVCWSYGTIADNWRIGNYAICTYPATELGDWNGLEILNHCTDVSGDMAHIIPGEYLLYEGNGHAGVYWGDGKVVECTVGWGQNGVILSDIDQYGNSYFNGVQRGRWYRHGKLPFIEDYPSVQYPIFNKGDKVTMVQGAKVYGQNIYFAPWVYDVVLVVDSQTEDRAVVYWNDLCIGAVASQDLVLYEAAVSEPTEPSEPEPMHPGADKPSEPTPTDPEPSEPNPPEEKIGFFARLIKGLLEVIVEVFKKEK